MVVVTLFGPYSTEPCDGLPAGDAVRQLAMPDEIGSWDLRLSAYDRDVLRDLLCFTAEGSLFGVLTSLDNLADLTCERVRFELWSVATDGGRVQIHDPDGDMLGHIFNGLE